jgi:hypothetical protein
VEQKAKEIIMSETERPVLLFTPGIDSLLALHALKDRDPYLVYYALASRYMEKEMMNLMGRGYNFITIDPTFNFNAIEQKDAYIPHRNLHLAMHSTATYGSEVYVGGTLSDRVSDNNVDIFADLSDICSKSLGKKVTIGIPFDPSKYKCEIAQEYINDGNDIMELVNTFSCYEPRHELTKLKVWIDDEAKEIETFECYRCKACFRKSVVLNSVGVYRAFNNTRIIEGYENDFVNGDDPRAIETMKYIQALKNGKTTET